MHKKWFWFLAPVALVAFIGAGGWVVMSLWNWLLPALFGWKSIGFWQALGLLALCRILFGGLGHHGGGRHCHRPGHGDHWGRQFTPEEKEHFREKMRSFWRAMEEPPTDKGPTGSSAAS
jgi:hypothetical protein